MARRGRPPKPTELHRITGTLNATRHVRDRADEPVPTTGNLIEPPHGLSESQIEAWSYALEHAPRGVLKKIDRGMLYVWVEAEDRHRRAVAAQALMDGQLAEQMPFIMPRGTRTTTKKNGDTVTVSGELVRSPYVAIINSAALIMIKAASELGFSPATRPRLMVDQQQDPEAPQPEWMKITTLQALKA